MATEAGSIRGGFAARVEDGTEEEKTPGERDPSSVTLCASKKKRPRQPRLASDGTISAHYLKSPLIKLLVPMEGCNLHMISASAQCGACGLLPPPLMPREKTKK